MPRIIVIYPQALTSSEKEIKEMLVAIAGREKLPLYMSATQVHRPISIWMVQVCALMIQVSLYLWVKVTMIISLFDSSKKYPSVDKEEFI